MNVYFTLLVWFVGFFAVTRLISMVGGRYHRYFRSSVNQDALASIALTVIVVYLL